MDDTHLPNKSGKVAQERARPIAVAAVEGLRALIRSGEFEPGDPIPAEQSLTEILKVSRGSVRHAINALVESGEVIRQPHCRPVVGNFRQKSRKRNGLDVHVWVSHPISDGATLMFLKGISLGLNGTPYRMLVREPTWFTGEHVQAEERAFLAGLTEFEDVAGAILERDAGAENGDVVQQLLKEEIPLVFVDCPPPDDLPADYVGTANITSARRGVEHLLELGHRRIACLVESELSRVTRDRILGYRRAMMHAGLEGNVHCLVGDQLSEVPRRLHPAGIFAPRCNVDGPYARWSHSLVNEVLSMPDRPTALFVGCDVLALWVVALLEGAGVRVPQDMSVVAFDWLARWEPAIPDFLTTAGQDFEGFGRYAVDLLLDRLTGVSPAVPRQVLFPAPLVVRSSTSPRPSHSAPDLLVGAEAGI